MLSPWKRSFYNDFVKVEFYKNLFMDKTFLVPFPSPSTSLTETEYLNP